jgi:hypothetical protein
VTVPEHLRDYDSDYPRCGKPARAILAFTTLVGPCPRAEGHPGPCRFHVPDMPATDAIDLVRRLKELP